MRSVSDSQCHGVLDWFIWNPDRSCLQIVKKKLCSCTISVLKHILAHI